MSMERVRASTIFVLSLAVMAGASGPAEAQEPAEAVMVAAGQWAAAQLPGGVARLDPHRSGAGTDGDQLQRVARALGASLERLEDVRTCDDVMDGASCTFNGGPLIAISAPRIDGDDARVKVYAWYRGASQREPVTQRSWELRLHRSGGAWSVVAGGR